jgi:hypothetical protein
MQAAGLLELDVCLFIPSHGFVEPSQPPVDVYAVGTKLGGHLQFPPSVIVVAGIGIEDAQIKMTQFHSGGSPDGLLNQRAGGLGMVHLPISVRWIGDGPGLIRVVGQFRLELLLSLLI